MAPPIEDDDDDEAEQDNETLGLQKEGADAADDSEVTEVKLYIRAIFYVVWNCVELYAGIGTRS